MTCRDAVDVRPDADEMRFTAATALPYENDERATAIIRQQIKQQMALASVESPPDWSGHEVTGPAQERDFYGRPWFWYTGYLRWPPER